MVIIGESVSKKYLSVYGYTQPTTPFLNTVKGTFYQNFISPAGYTALSLPRMLALTHNYNDIEYETNVVTLAKKAGYTTHWYSNQGLVGKFETANSLISVRSDFIKYMNIYRHKEYYPENNLSSDFKLLENLKDINFKKKNVIFLHMLGSHSDFCNRLKDYKLIQYLEHGKNFNCYLSTINLLDDFTNQIYNTLIDKKTNFSIIYLSDHGLQLIGSHNDLNLIHGDKSRQNFDVPFFILRDNDTKKIFIDEPTSGFNFLHIFAKELGVETRNLKVHHPIKVLSQNKFIDYEKLERSEKQYAFKK